MRSFIVELRRSLLDGFQLNACAARVERRQRDGKSSGDVHVAENGARRCLLQSGHVSVSDHVSLHLRKALQHIWISKADADDGSIAAEQRIECACALFRQTYACGLSR